MPLRAVPLLLAAVLVAACAPSANEVEEFTASLTLGSTLEASLQPGPATVTAPAALGLLATASDEPLGQAVALIWFAHIGMDRALGYGLKYETDFKDTHLGRIGR